MSHKGESNMSPLELAAWVQMAESGELRRYLSTSALVPYETQLRRDAARLGSMLRREGRTL